MLVAAIMSIRYRHRPIPPFSLTVLSLGDELQGQSVAASRGTVGALVLGSVHGAVRRAGRRIRADGSVPLVARVAVGVTTDIVEPAPVSVDGDLAVDGRAAAGGCALLPGHLGMRLGRLLADGLARDRPSGGQGSHDSCSLGVHHNA